MRGGSMSRAYECDRCGMLFKPYKNQKTSEFLNITKNPNTTGNCLDLCPKCNDRLQEWVKNGKVQVKYIDSEISKSFIEDVETVKDLLPQTASEDNKNE